MRGRVAALLKQKGDVEWLTSLGIHIMQCHQTHSLFNVSVTREEHKLVIEHQDIILQRK